MCAEKEHPVPTAEVGPCAAVTSSVSCSFNPTPSSLSDEQKYQILSTSPATLKMYPVNSQKRCYQPYWAEQFPWVWYSALLDGVFCGPCFLFSLVRFNSEFVSSPFHNWKNAVGTSHSKLNRHFESQTHKQHVEEAVTFIAVMEKISSQSSLKLVKQMTSRSS